MKSPIQPIKLSRVFYITLVSLIFVGGVTLSWKMQELRTVENALAAYGGDFTLEAPWGKSGLSDYRGKLVLIYFGFASCPDVCPTSLGIMKSALKLLKGSEQENIAGLFISIDPERDTPELTENYAQYFHPGFHGLSGKPEAIAQVAKQYNVLYKKMDTPESAMGYTLDHSSVTFLVDQQGVLREKIQHGATPKEVAEKLREYL